MFLKVNLNCALPPFATLPKSWLVVVNIFLAHSWAGAVAAEANRSMVAIRKARRTNCISAAGKIFG